MFLYYQHIVLLWINIPFLFPYIVDNFFKIFFYVFGMAILLKICSFHVVYMQKTIDFYYKNNYNYIVMFTITFMERSVQV